MCSGWGDLLTAHNGTTITYDRIGNPLSYYGDRTFTWEGRELRTATTPAGWSVFAYNDNGTRALKYFNGSIVTYYYYDGTRLISEKNQNETIIYIHDDYGSVIGMQYRLTTYAEDVWDVYWFERNLQGDVIAVYNTTGTKLISYTYDAWGNFTTTYYNNGASTTAVKNPFKYRGYYYDSDLQLYYLQTRYYDSVTGRFISADDISYLGANGDLNSFNLYAYCSNNPVNYLDPTGNSAILVGIIVGAILGAGIGFGTVAYTDYQDDGQIFNGSVEWYEYAGGTVTGAILGAGTGGIIASGGAALTGGITSVTNKFISDLFAYTLTGTSFGTWEDYAVAFISGGFIKGMGVKGVANTVYDVLARPAINQLVKIGTNRQDLLNFEKYSYDVITRGLTTLAPSPWKAFYRGLIRSFWDLGKR